MQNPYLAELVASGRVAADGTTNGAGFFARGCAVTFPGGAGTGIYVVTLDRALDADQSVIKVQGETADVCHSVTHTTDLAKTVTFTATPGGAAADSIFSFAIFKVAGGGGSTGR